MRTIQQLFKAFSDYMTVWSKVKIRQGDPENLQRVIYGNISIYSGEALPVTKKTLFLQHNT
jgi:hypothetical protein